MNMAALFFIQLHLHINSERNCSIKAAVMARKKNQRNKETIAVPADTVSTVKETKSWTAIS